MEPQTDLPTLVEDLEVNIDELTTTLAPLLASPFSKTASSLPLLDKSKLYVLAAYSIESLLFSTLQASGINAKEHAIFPELARLKGYFGKIKEIEDRGVKGSAEGRARLDVGAAQRFIKHGLSGNERYDLERREKMAKEKARAAIKARQINKKFDNEGKAGVEDKTNVTPKKRAVDDVDVDVDDASAAEDNPAHDSNNNHPTRSANPVSSNHTSKKPRVSTETANPPSSTSNPSSPPSSPQPDKPHSKQQLQQQQSSQPNPAPTKKRRARSKKSALHDSPPPTPNARAEPATRSTRKSRRHNPRTFDEQKAEELVLPLGGVKGGHGGARSAVFSALLGGGGDGELDGEKGGEEGGKRQRKRKGEGVRV
ncbi:hypothetical protein LEMA_P113470.1 [Plenodomus lingam JN3]|uniref:Exosome complex protein n=1 Tax=Leptosphaeria maculans (strain JN3 / isolate v23.1.3 / race Av1-4-5-6-7-8) TaxID=985895 RepID=E4ZUZ5_LEPMJ|nr:hypothetical protein LEMA_P113470.1 [Plenodomus lingam JN3]CBX94932.1 hypothetical protein LEMA_P113470.1 [Plenodomus lingam JN3]